MQMSIIEVFICRRLHMNTSMIPVCIWLICRLCTALHTKCCGAVMALVTDLTIDMLRQQYISVTVLGLEIARLWLTESRDARCENQKHYAMGLFSPVPIGFYIS